MSVTVEDCLKLPSLKEARVVGGAKGLQNVVVSVSVLEYAVPTALDRDYFKNNEIVITAFISVKDDVEAQCGTLRRLHEVGEVGLILYYVGLYLPEIDKRLIDTADELNFPLICMPENRSGLRYSEVICDVMEAIFKDQTLKTYFVGEMIDRISRIPSGKRTMDTILRMISDRIRCTVIVTNKAFKAIYRASWPMDSEELDDDATEFCRLNVSALVSKGMVEMYAEGKSKYVCSKPVAAEKGQKFNVVLVREDPEMLTDSCSQAAEVVRLFINIWSRNEGSEGSSELVRAILNDEPVKMRRLADIMHVDVASIHIMWVINIKEKLPADKKAALNTEIMIKLRQFLKEQRRVAVTDIFEGKVVAFMDNPPFIDSASHLAEMFLDDVGDKREGIILSLCTSLENTSEVREAYGLFKEHIQNARIIFPHKEILTYHEISFASGCYDIIHQGEESVKRCLLALRTLQTDKSDQENELINTASVFMLDAEENIIKASEMLFVHKSTVKYRVHKINEYLNFNIQKMPESYKLYTALAVKRLFEGLK